MRLIDADALIKRLQDWYCAPERCDSYHGIRCRACAWDDAMNAIDEAPTIAEENDIMRFPAIDAVPVVRCGECRHRLGCLISDGPDGSKDWFCADGEREEQERIEL